MFIIRPTDLRLFTSVSGRKGAVLIDAGYTWLNK